ncbi:MAG: SAM-dependent methyltransferase [Patescibacteria group bacterium]|jgi:ubiquinone/menaquinone biosynthesis C-methylase UbiE|nr:SAM-dependent methyltransferase [Patescibacteria group bacterium]
MSDPIGQTGNYGNLADAYEEGRQEYPSYVMSHVRDLVANEPGAKTLDIGCGTGISTRDLAGWIPGAVIDGVDADEDCIQKALEVGGQGLTYQVASAQNLPFLDEMFHMATTFGSFHWWYRLPGVLDEVLRILEPGGIFVIVNKNDTGTFRKELVEIIERLCDKPVRKSVKEDYDPVQVMQNDGRWEVESKEWQHIEQFDLEGLISQIRSMTPWNVVLEKKSKELEKEAEEEMNRHFGSQMKEGIYYRPLLIRAVVARKKD